MATWRARRAWRREFKSLGIRQVKAREAHSVWHEEKAAGGQAVAAGAGIAPLRHHRDRHSVRSAATRIRPDILLIACMDEVSPGLRTSAGALQSRLGAETKVELLEFQANALKRNSRLPA
jgi:hypothetical protein